jgi:hypothetical protein
MKEDVAYVMSIPEEQLRAMVPRQSGIYFTDCPNCGGGAQDRANWKWLPQSPRQLTCKDCGEVYPDNPKYPDSEFIEVAAPGGEHRYHYHERKDGYRIFFRAAADYLAKDYLPGTVTMWRGIVTLQTMVVGWRLARGMPAGP